MQQQNACFEILQRQLSYLSVVSDQYVENNSALTFDEIEQRQFLV